MSTYVENVSMSWCLHDNGRGIPTVTKKLTGFWPLELHDDVIKWKHFPRYWPFCGELNSHQWILLTEASNAEARRASMFSLIDTWTNGWVNNQDASGLRCHRVHYDVTVMSLEHNLTHPDLNKMVNNCRWHFEIHFLEIIFFEFWFNFDSKSSLVQVIPWCSRGNKPQFEPIVTYPQTSNIKCTLVGNKIVDLLQLDLHFCLKHLA